MDTYHYIVSMQTENLSEINIINFSYLLHFQIMVAGAERAYFVLLAFFCMVGDVSRLSPCNSASFLGAVEVILCAEAFLDCPLGPPDKHLIHFAPGEFLLASAAQPGRYSSSQLL